MKKTLNYIIIAFLLVVGLSAVNDFLNTPKPQEPTIVTPSVKPEEKIAEDGKYYSRDDIALYIHTYNKLPGNFVSKSKARNLGWRGSKANLWDVCDGCVIGGDKFENREGRLPEKEGRQYRECDYDFDGTQRNDKRIIYSNDGLIYYTDDHYKTFTLLYGDE